VSGHICGYYIYSPVYPTHAGTRLGLRPVLPWTESLDRRLFELLSKDPITGPFHRPHEGHRKESIMAYIHASDCIQGIFHKLSSVAGWALTRRGCNAAMTVEEANGRQPVLKWDFSSSFEEEAQGIELPPGTVWVVYGDARTGYAVVLPVWVERPKTVAYRRPLEAVKYVSPDEGPGVLIRK
jgi:hypothetical protein